MLCSNEQATFALQERTRVEHLALGGADGSLSGPILGHALHEVDVTLLVSGLLAMVIRVDADFLAQDLNVDLRTLVDNVRRVMR